MTSCLIGLLIVNLLTSIASAIVLYGILHAVRDVAATFTRVADHVTGALDE